MNSQRTPTIPYVRVPLPLPSPPTSIGKPVGVIPSPNNVVGGSGGNTLGNYINGINGINGIVNGPSGIELVTSPSKGGKKVKSKASTPSTSDTASGVATTPSAANGTSSKITDEAALKVQIARIKTCFKDKNRFAEAVPEFLGLMKTKLKQKCKMF